MIHQLDMTTLIDEGFANFSNVAPLVKWIY